MEIISIQKEIRVDINLALGDDDFFLRDHLTSNKRMIAVSPAEGLCVMYIKYTKDDGSYHNSICGTYAFRESDYGIQYFGGSHWRYFDKKVQQQWSDYVAEKVILEEGR